VAALALGGGCLEDVAVLRRSPNWAARVALRHGDLPAGQRAGGQRAAVAAGDPLGPAAAREGRGRWPGSERRARTALVLADLDARS
jgi:hypothetical protein